MHIIFKLLVSGVFFQQVFMQVWRLEQIFANYNEAQYLFMNVIWASQYPIVITVEVNCSTSLAKNW